MFSVRMSGPNRSAQPPVIPLAAWGVLVWAATFAAAIEAAAPPPPGAPLTEVDRRIPGALGTEGSVGDVTEPLVQLGYPVAGTQATWLRPAEYASMIGPVSVLQVRPDIYMLTLNGRNLAVHTGWQGALVIGAGGEQCDALVAAVSTLIRAPIRYVVNTSADAHNVGCNAELAKAGHGFFPTPEGFVAPVIAHNNALLRLLRPGGVKLEAVGVPSETFARPVRNMYMNDQGVQVYWMPMAHSDGDTVTVFRRSDVVVAGDIVDLTAFPVIDLERGGSVRGELAALNRLIDEFVLATTPRWQRPGGTLVIPGRGQLANQTDIVNYRDMVTIIRDRVQALIDEGKSLEEIQAARPARGYEVRYGKDPRWTTRQFVDAVYQSLKSEPSVPRGEG